MIDLSSGRVKIILFSSTVVLALFILFTTAYLAGRFQLVERTWNRIRNQQPPDFPFYLVDQQSAPGVAEERYEELNNLLDQQLEKNLLGASRWQNILEVAEKSEQEEVVASIRTELLKTLSPWPGPRPDLSPVYGESIVRPGLSGQLIEITTHPGVKLTGVLLKPTQREEPLPALIVLHGMYGGIDALIDDIDYHHAMAAELARAGFIVFAPLRVDTTIESRNTLYVKALAAGWSLEALNLWQLVRTVRTKMLMQHA